VEQDAIGKLATTAGIVASAVVGSGTWIKFVDGTLICRRSAFPTVANADATWTFPLPPGVSAFASVPTVIPSVAYSGGMRAVAFSTITTTTAKIRTSDMTGDESLTPNVDLIAIGRWY